MVKGAAKKVLNKANTNWEKFLIAALIIFQVFGVEPRLTDLEHRLDEAASTIIDLADIRNDIVEDVEGAVRRAEGRGVAQGIRLICRHPDADDIPICRRRT